MKYKILTLFCFLALFQSLQAQFVTIPDPIFVSYLQTQFPTCMNGNQMDTTCPGIVNATIISANATNIADLTGVQYFDNLQTLQSTLNNIGSLPPLPATLQSLMVSDNHITSFPPLPAGLQELHIESNGITVLPTLPPNLVSLRVSLNPIGSWPIFPSTLVELYISNCGLTAMPALPAGLRWLTCGYNPNIGSLGNMPPALETMIVINNALTALPALPSTLAFLDVSDNYLTSLPTLPSGLQDLRCELNQITALPPLPTTLINLVADHNELSSLPTLPSNLVYLYAQNNQLTNLGNLPPSLLDVDVSNNQITCFAPFPQVLGTIVATNNPFTCLPNYPANMQPPASSFPICTAGNAMGCASAHGIGGTVYEDLNGNCTMNGLEPGLMNMPVKLYDNLGTLVQSGSSQPNGSYFFSVGLGDWTVALDTAGQPFQVQCAHPGTDSLVNLGPSDSLAHDVDFGVECKPGFDVGCTGIATAGWISPGRFVDVRVLAGDASGFYGLHCATGVSGQVVFTYNGPCSFTSPLFGALTPTVSGNTLTYTIPDFGAVNPLQDFGFTLLIDTTALLDDVVCLHVDVTPTLGDRDTVNNHYTSCLPVTASFDPNTKEVTPDSVQPGYEGWLNYTVHFQNTGNAPAFNIRVEDTLDQNLELASVEMLAASHYETWNLYGNRLVVYFPNINLIDSLTDPVASQGWFMYRVKPKPNLPLGTTIPNSAAIYFDFNPPVITNTATTSFDHVTSSEPAVHPETSIGIHPNPSAGIFEIRLPSDWRRTEWTICNAMGQVIQRGTATGLDFSVDLTALPSGMYLLKAASGKSMATGRLVRN